MKRRDGVSRREAESAGKPWWSGARGEWFVVAQIVLMALIFFGPRTMAGRPTWPFPFPEAFRIAGAVLLVAGGALFVAGLFRLGRGLTPLPYPKDGASFVQTGPYALVRHPMYGGGIILALGWGLFVRGWLTLVCAIALFVLLDAKARREEKWLEERFPNYAAYRRRVRKFVPFVY